MTADKPIPDAIMRAAADFCRSRGVSPMDTPFHPTPAVLAVIDAIMARDERAAKIAEGNSRDFDFQKALAEGSDFECGAHSTRIAIATAIRNGGE